MSAYSEYPSPSYLPMDCPLCGRRRLEAYIRHNPAEHRAWVYAIQCEKCLMQWPEVEATQEGKDK